MEKTKQSFKVPVQERGITLQELPGEITLYFNLGNCSCHCRGCHSQHLWDTNVLTTYRTPAWIIEQVQHYASEITAVLFMGGNRNGMDFTKFIQEVVKPVSQFGKPIGIYLGDWTADDLQEAAQYCRWIKVGRYDDSKGGLATPGTNQIFLEVQTDKFQKRKRG